MLFENHRQERGAKTIGRSEAVEHPATFEEPACPSGGYFSGKERAISQMSDFDARKQLREPSEMLMGLRIPRRKKTNSFSGTRPSPCRDYPSIMSFPPGPKSAPGELAAEIPW